MTNILWYKYQLSKNERKIEAGYGSVESASIDTAEKPEDEIKAQFKTREKKKQTKKDKKRRAKKVRGRGGKISRRVEDRGGSYGRRTSFAGSVSVTGKRSLVCCSHIQVLM